MSKAMEAMIKARAQIILWNDWRAAFFGTLIMNMPLVETSEAPTLATDGESLFYNPQYVLSLSEAERLTGLAHEALHCGLCHFDRMLGLPIVERNVCMDYPINEQLAKAGFSIPKGWLINRDYYGKSAEQLHPILFPRKPPAEQPRGGSGQENEQPGSEDGQETGDQPGDGSEQETGQETGQPPAEQPGSEAGTEAGQETGSDQPGSDQPGGTEQETRAGGTEAGQETGGGSEAGKDAPGGTEQPVAASAQPGDGTDQPGGKAGQGTGQAGNEPGGSEAGQSAGLPAGINENLGPGGILPSPARSPAEQTEMRQKWEQIVRQAANAAKVRNAGTMPDIAGQLITQFEKARIDWREVLASFIDSRAVSRETWKRPDRRFAMRNFVMPSRERYGIGHLVWAVDVSGSMDEVAFDNVAAEIKSAWAEGRINKLTIVYTNTIVVRVDEYESGSELEINPPIGGGTDFRECMDWIANNADDATAIVFFTDLIVSEFGQEPDCSVLWLQYGDYNNAKVPYGEIVQLS